jgi:hypothetical protein
MRWLYALYFCVVAVVTSLLIFRDPEMAASLRATKDLPFNHLILEGDLSEPAWRVGGASGPVQKAKFAGMYTTGEVRKGQMLHIFEVRAAPMPGPPHAGIRLLVTAEAAHITAGAVNARRKAKLCAGPDDVQEILATSVMCAPGLTDPCQAVVDLPADLLAKLGEKLKDGQAHIVPQASSCK